MTEFERNIGQDGTGFDRVLGFTLPDRNARGRGVRLGPVLSEILAPHAYPPPIRDLLAEALVLAALMGGLLKRAGGQLTLQVQAPGAAAELLVCDYLDGALRGYIKHDPGALAALPADPTLADLFGEGALTVTFDLAETGQRYQGVVPLEGPSLTAAVERYFARSEQIPTLLRTAVRADGPGPVAAGLLIQHLAEGEEGGERLHVRLDHPEWEHVAVLAGTVRAEELTDRLLPLEALVWRLFNEEREIRAEPGAVLSRGCRCSVERFEQVLARFPKEDRRDMRNAEGVIVVDCAFCAREFPIQD
ncbi:MAG: molecular chaperone Hsp33 [Sphingomonadales bacterium 32-68-7]|nr:MAG: molecular chaperone Hsp33 [Sphingomonadales bacterium 12-68-11]OYX08802.1 MAG: molecular chaperone Hsp33 [Sphingomonadales bacterium 32-68-7]